MADFIETYRGYDIYYYVPGEYPGYQDDGYSAADIDLLFAFLPDLKGHIDALLEPEPPPPLPPPPPPPPEPEEPEFVETYRDVDIYWLPDLEMYWAQVAVGYVAVAYTLEEMYPLIDEILDFLNPPEDPDEGLLAQIVAAIVAWVQENLGSHLQPIYDWIDVGLAAAQTAWEGLVADVVTYVNGVAEALTSLGEEVWDRWDEFNTVTLPGIGDALDTAVTDLTAALDTLGADLEAFIANELVDFAAWVEGLLADLDPHSLLPDPDSYIGTVFNTLISPWVEDIVKSFSDGLDEAMEE